MTGKRRRAKHAPNAEISPMLASRSARAMMASRQLSQKTALKNRAMIYGSDRGIARRIASRLGDANEMPRQMLEAFAGEAGSA